MKETLEFITNILEYTIKFSDKVSISIGNILLLIVILVFAKAFLNFFEKLVTKRLNEQDTNKFHTVFSFSRWLIYIVIFLTTLHSVGFNLNAIFAASAALLVGVGLAMQTWFQDIMSGIFIIIDQSVHIGDIIELDNKVGRVEEIKLRTTRAITIDNKVLIIPNHLYLTNILYNWTQNGKSTRESVSIGVAYGSDIELVKQLLIQAANKHPKIMKHPAPLVLFEDFGDSALQFKLIFTLNDSFTAVIPKSEIRFTIDRLFREHNITIPFPQRDIHLIKD